MAVDDEEIKPTTKKVFSGTIGGRHLLICNLITDAIDPISGKTCNNFIVQVLDKVNPDEPLGEKKFVWPEDDLPEFTIEQKPNLTLLMKGKRNIAQLPFQIPRHFLPKLSENPKFIPPVAFRTNFNGPTERVDNSQGLTQFAREFATKLDEERWKMLVQQCSLDDLPIPLPFISIDSLTDEQQLSLMNALQKKVKTKQQEGQVFKVFNVLLKQRIFTATAFRELLKTLIDGKCQKLLSFFLKSPLSMINDEDFVEIVKFSLELKDDQCSEIFMELITKGFTIVTIREQFLKQLTTKEAIQVLNIGVNILDQKANNEFVCEKTLDLLCALIDSHCDKLIWEDECYPILNRAKFYVQSMTEMTTAFSRLLSKNKAKTEIPELEASADTDFIIERIKFKKIKII